MSTAHRRLAAPSKTVTQTANTIYAEYLEKGKLDLSPPYQRARCWKQKQNNGLIDTIMTRWPMPLVTFYKLHSTNPDDAEAYAKGYRFECVDGQNRLAAIQAFRAGTPLTSSKGKEEGVFWYRDGAAMRYVDLSEEEREDFDSYDMAVTVIQSPMTLSERKAMFTRLQDGTRISAADYMYNSDHAVSVFASNTDLRSKFLPVVRGLMTSANGDWLDVLADCATLYLRRADESPFEALDRSQSELRKVLKRICDPAPGTKYDMPVKVSDYEPLTALFDQLIAALEPAKGEKIKCHKFHVTVLFQHLLTGGAIPSVSALHDWFGTYKRIGSELEAGTRSPEVYAGLLETLRNPEPKAEAPPKRRSPAKKKRMELWHTYFGEAHTGTCQCCEGSITIKTWEQAHITAVANGGTNDVANLVPTCRDCNRSCGTRNLMDWCYEEYPAAPLLRTAGDE